MCFDSHRVKDLESQNVDDRFLRASLGPPDRGLHLRNSLHPPCRCRAHPSESGEETYDGSLRGVPSTSPDTEWFKSLGKTFEQLLSVQWLVPFFTRRWTLFSVSTRVYSFTDDVFLSSFPERPRNFLVLQVPLLSRPTSSDRGEKEDEERGPDETVVLVYLYSGSRLTK